MGRKSARKPSHQPAESPLRNENGADGATVTTATDQSAMNSSVEYRRKPAHNLQPPLADTLMSRPSFSLDDPVPTPPAAAAISANLDIHTHTHNLSYTSDPSAATTTIVAAGAASGFRDLPGPDRSNFLLLVLLYFLQGVPIGLATGSVPFLIKDHVSYSAIGIFSLASYPYSLKLFWSPVVDAIWSPRIGRRKSWILPIQALSGLGMLWLGARIEPIMDAAAAGGRDASVWPLTGWWFFLVLMCATQDIAVDGWALTLLSPTNVSFAGTAQTVGLTAGQFLSYTVFLAFNSADFANRWFRSTPADVGLVTLGGYLTFWGWAYLAVTVVLAVFKREERARNEDGVWDVYRIMGGILRLPAVRTILAVHLVAKIGFQANEGVTNLKLLDRGFGKENMALTVLIDFPFEIGIGYYAGKWCQEYTPMRLWGWGFVGRLVAAVMAQCVMAAFPAGGVTTGYLLLVVASHVFSTFTSTIMFVAVSAFHANIADPVIGGTYMTLLATVANLGGTFPRYPVLTLVDKFTVATCRPAAGEPFSCAVQTAKERCEAGGGTCEMVRDGYYIVNMLCVVFGAVLFTWYIRPRVAALQRLPMRAWRLAPSKGEK